MPFSQLAVCQLPGYHIFPRAAAAGGLSKERRLEAAQMLLRHWVRKVLKASGQGHLENSLPIPFKIL